MINFSYEEDIIFPPQDLKFKANPLDDFSKLLINIEYDRHLTHLVHFTTRITKPKVKFRAFHL